MSDKFKRLLKKKMSVTTKKAKSLDSAKDDCKEERDTALLIPNCEPVCKGKILCVSTPRMHQQSGYFLVSK